KRSPQRRRHEAVARRREGVVEGAPRAGEVAASEHRERRRRRLARGALDLAGEAVERLGREVDAGRRALRGEGALLLEPREVGGDRDGRARIVRERVAVLVEQATLPRRDVARFGAAAP